MKLVTVHALALDIGLGLMWALGFLTGYIVWGAS